MKTSTATTSISDLQTGMLKLFQSWADESFAKSINSWNEQAFYQHVLKKLDAKVDLTNDLPELKSLKPKAAKAVVQRLMKQAGEVIEAAWELKPSVAKLFRTSIRVHMTDEASLLPCFDVEYKAKTEQGIVTISVVTQRREVKISIEGEEAALNLLHGQVVMAGMRREVNV
jgi:hypothetical protein